MKTAKPIHYEPHPVSRERKAELQRQGYMIVDAIYRPNDAEPAEEPTAAPEVAHQPKRRGRPRKA